MKLTPCACRRAHHEHGTYNAYTTDGCRCDDCTEAARLYRKRTRLKAHRGIAGRVPAGPAITHIRRLMAAGWGLNQIAAASGVNVTQVGYIIGNNAKADIGRYVYRKTLVRLLSVQPHTMPSKGTVDATGTHRRIQALAAAGWPLDWLAAPTTLKQSLAFPTVTRATRDRVAELYERVCDTQPPTTTPDQQRQVTRCRTLARRKGWLPPAAWDLDIDEPDAEPSTPTASRVGLAAAEVAHLLGSESAEAIAARLGYLSVDNLANTVANRDKPLADKLRATQTMKAVA